MNRREFLGHLANYYTIAAVTKEPFGLYLPFNRTSNFLNHHIGYEYYSNISYFRSKHYAVVGIYDEKDRIVYSNACYSSSYSRYTYVKINGVSYYYSTNFDSVDISRPGKYTSRVIFSGFKSKPLVPVVEFEVKPIEKKSNYGRMRVEPIWLDHAFEDDETNENGILYYDIPDYLKYGWYHS